MPRPDKPINPGKKSGYLDDAASSSRAQVWTKHGGAVAGRGAPSDISVTVDDLTIVTTPPEGPSGKYEQRGMAGHAGALDVAPEDAIIPAERIKRTKEWVSDRAIEGRIYRRTDAAYMVEEPI